MDDVQKISSKFFEFGQASLESSDKQSRQILIYICAPYCLIQTITPIMLGNGLIDEYTIRNPIAIWVPFLNKERFKETSLNISVDEVLALNKELHKILESSALFFRDMSILLKDPSDLVSILPLGIYVKFRYRCDADNLLKVLMSLESMKDVIGVTEIQFALAEIYAKILREWDT